MESQLSIGTSEFMSFDKVTEILPLREKKRDVIQLLVRIGNQL